MAIKSFSQFLKEGRIGSGILDEPIHFKHVYKKFSDDDKKSLTEEKNPAWQFFSTNDNKHLGKTPSVIAKKLGSKNNYTPEQKQAITAYSAYHDGDDSKDRKNWHSYQINSRLISGKKLPKEKQKTVAGLDSAISSNPIQHSVSTYSGISFDPRKKLDEKGRFKSPAFISSTHNKKQARSFAYKGYRGYNPIHIMQFHLKPGDPASHISQQSHFEGEHETVIGRDNTFQYHGTDSHYDHDNEHWVHVHHVSIV